MSRSERIFRRRRWLTHFAPLVVWTVVILGLGGPMGSMNETSRFVRPLLEFLFPASSPETLTFIHGYIRKSAHFVEYAVLGYLAFRAFLSFAISRRFAWAFILSIALSTGIAALDEYQQSFNPERTSSIFDSLIDIAGAAAATVLAYAWLKSRKTPNLDI